MRARHRADSRGGELGRGQGSWPRGWIPPHRARRSSCSSFLAEHRLVLPAHAGALLGTSADAATTRLPGSRPPASSRLIPASTASRAATGSRARGWPSIASPLPPPRLDLRAYEHDVGVAWLWLAARGGTFGPLEELISERRLRSLDAVARPGAEPRGGRLGGFGPRRQATAALPGSAARPPAASGSRSSSSSHEGTRPPREDPLRLRRRPAHRRGPLPRRQSGGRAGGPGRRAELGISELVHLARVRPTVARAASTAALGHGARRASRRTSRPRRCDDRHAANRRPAPLPLLAAFAALLLLPTGPAAAIAAAMLAAAVVRGVRFLARRRSSPGHEGEVVLGVDRRGRLVRLDDNELSAHGLILGASGAGKSTTLLTILTDQIRRGRPVVAIDMKGSPAFARDLAESRPRRAPVPSGRSTAGPLESARARQRDRAEGQADRHRAVHRAPLPARGRALRADRAAGARRPTPTGRRRPTRSWR